MIFKYDVQKTLVKWEAHFPNNQHSQPKKQSCFFVFLKNATLLLNFTILSSKIQNHLFYLSKTMKMYVFVVFYNTFGPIFLLRQHRSTPPQTTVSNFAKKHKVHLFNLGGRTKAFLLTGPFLEHRFRNPPNLFRGPKVKWRSPLRYSPSFAMPSSRGGKSEAQHKAPRQGSALPDAGVPDQDELCCATTSSWWVKKK